MSACTPRLVWTAILVSGLAACGAAVDAAHDGSDSAGGSGGVSDAGEEGETSSGSLAPACAAELEHGPVNREQVASSLAAVLCIAQEDCCTNARPADSCRHAMNMTFEELDARALELGLTYDGDCAGYQQAVVDAVGCDVALPPWFAEFGGCSVYFGEAGLDEACESIGTLGSTCGQGLACAAGRCVDPCVTESFARPYVYGHACVGGEVVVGSRCESAAYLGDACLGNCAQGLVCGVEQSCEAAGSLGDPCTRAGECRDLACVGQVCDSGQPEGAPCRGGCGLGLQCDAQTELCAARPYVCIGASSI